MPELPEVEVVRAGLAQHVLGATITSVEVLHPRPVRRDPRGPAGFADGAHRPADRGRPAARASTSGSRSTTATPCSATSA